MDTEVFKEFIKPEMLILIPVLYAIGTFLKSTLLIKDKFIPLFLGVLGIILAVVWVLATESMATMQDGLMAAFVAITQGILCAGASVYINQTVVVQPKKEE